ncbi:MAG: hypothetical protein KVP17_000782 [Porospora cf. gigantea B]|uniref:uncharacterized protein n=2 Tax=Porospora cf. gigantea B TaxID=2853592 RepID=UPI003571E731|nr:MAG: hypothetical protein KVP17_000782 [Porospora cf. gigantea B]
MSDVASDSGVTETEFSDSDWHWGDQEYDNADFERLIASRVRRASISASGDFTSLREVVPRIRQQKDKRKLSAIPDSRLMREALEDCFMRFVVGMPPNFSRTLHFYFQLQKAFFFYEDFWVDNHRGELPRLSFRAFGTLLTLSFPLAQCSHFDQLYCVWQCYNRHIPRRGAILLNKQLNKVIMVRQWGSQHWMFPRGKIEQGETDRECAVREILEELSLNLRTLIHEDVFIEVLAKGQSVKLFVVPDMSEDVVCYPHTRKEIESTKWVSLESLSPPPKYPRIRVWRVVPFLNNLHKMAILIRKKPRLVDFHDWYVKNKAEFDDLSHGPIIV